MDRNRMIGTTTSLTPADRRVTLVSVASALSQLTVRDRWFLDLLDAHRTFTTEQVASLAFGSIDRARNRLNVLYSRGVIDRFRLFVRPGSQSWRWTLGPLGAAVVAAAEGRKFPRPSAVRDATARLATSPGLNHLIGVNGIFAELIAAARNRDGAELARWWSESRTAKTCANMVRPDGHGVWIDAGRRVPFYLEYDTGTEALPVVVRKLGDYANLAGTRMAYPVAFWFPGSVREANFRARLAHTGLPAGVTVVTAAGDYATGHGGPSGPVWSILGRAERVTLAGLPVPVPVSTDDAPEPSGGAPWSR